MAPDNIPLCPMNGKPCFHPKTFHVTEVKDYQATQEHHLCNGCSPTYIALHNQGQDPVLISPEIKQIPVQAEEPEPTPIPVKTTPIPKKYIETAEELFQLFAMKPKAKVKKKKNEPACPTCGMTPADFQRKGKLGCPDCYTYYKDDMPEVVKGCQDGATKHVGKKPKGIHGDPEEVRKTLKLHLAHAIEMERYEDAAKLKKQIEALTPPPEPEAEPEVEDEAP